MLTRFWPAPQLAGREAEVGPAHPLVIAGPRSGDHARLRAEGPGRPGAAAVVPIHHGARPATLVATAENPADAAA
jgi:hypothetical protein